MGKIEPTKMTWLPMCGLITQLVEHRTGIRGGHGFESRWSPGFFSRLVFPIAQIGGLKVRIMQLLEVTLKPCITTGGSDVLAT